MASNLTHCHWQPIDGFANDAEFDSFCHWVRTIIAAQEMRKVPEERLYQGIESLKEEWSQHTGSKTLWRLVYPDGPFRGLLEQVVNS